MVVQLTAPTSSPQPIAVSEPSQSVAAAPAERCARAAPPKERVDNGLTVHDPPHKRARISPSRMRSHVEGSLSAGAVREWVGPPVPAFVDLVSGTRQLFIMDPAGERFFALYRDQYDVGSCKLSDKTATNCGYEARLHECNGAPAWTLPLNSLLSRPDHLEVQDIHYDGDVLYFNEACQSYSREAKGKCSSLVAVDPKAGKVLWRTPPLTSNGEFLVLPRHIVSGYGFTAEPDFVFVVRRSDGAVIQKKPIPTAAYAFEVGDDGKLSVFTYAETTVRFTMTGFDGDAPQLSAVPATKR